MFFTRLQELQMKAAFLREKEDGSFADDEYLEYLLQRAKDDAAPVTESQPLPAPRVTVRITHINSQEAACHLCPNSPLYTYEMRRGSESWRIPLCATHIQKKNTTLKLLFPKTTSHLLSE